MRYWKFIAVANTFNSCVFIEKKKIYVNSKVDEMLNFATSNPVRRQRPFLNSQSSGRELMILKILERI